MPWWSPSAAGSRSIIKLNKKLRAAHKKLHAITLVVSIRFVPRGGKAITIRKVARVTPL